jgi:predicted transcriptional regulator
MTVRLPEEVAARLEALARSTDRTKAYLASRAIEEYVSLHEWQVSAIVQGVAEADSADASFLDHDEVESRLAQRVRPKKKGAKR